MFDSMVIRWRLAGSGREAQLRSPSELRAGSEPAAAGFAAGHATPQQRGMLTGAVMEMAVHGRAVICTPT
jgi:DNA-binding FadR family transcriptional regulator